MVGFPPFLKPIKKADKIYFQIMINMLAASISLDPPGMQEGQWSRPEQSKSACFDLTRHRRPCKTVYPLPSKIFLFDASHPTPFRPGWYPKKMITIRCFELILQILSANRSASSIQHSTSTPNTDPESTPDLNRPAMKAVIKPARFKIEKDPSPWGGEPYVHHLMNWTEI